MHSVATGQQLLLQLPLCHLTCRPSFYTQAPLTDCLIERFIAQGVGQAESILLQDASSHKELGKQRVSSCRTMDRPCSKIQAIPPSLTFLPASALLNLVGLRRWDDLQKPEYLSVDPGGRVPILEDTGMKMKESGAITQFLAEKYGKGRVTLPPGTPEHAAYCQVG